MADIPETDTVTEVDYLVIGSGGGGMLSAIVAREAGLNVLVVEKGALYGGTTAISGGVAWIPDNHLTGQAGLDDSEQKARTYLNSVIGDEASPEKIDAYVKYAPEMARYMDENTEAGWLPHPTFMDYFPENAGGTPGGRGLDPKPVNGKRLGKEFDYLQPNAAKIMGRFRITAREGKDVAAMNLKSYWLMARTILRYYLDIPSRLRGPTDARLTNGSALIGGLRLTMKKMGIPLWLNAPASELIVDAGKVVGAIIERGGKRQRVRARRAVLMATGGFAQNQQLRDRYQIATANANWSLSNPNATGDAIAMAEKVGADLEYMEAAWWTPVLTLPSGDNEFFLASRGMPHSLMVNQAGERFLNEAGSYDEVGKGIHRAQAEQNNAIPCFFIFDGAFRRSSPMGMQIPPSNIMPDERLPPEFFDSGWLKKADSLAELAALIDVDPAALQSTVDQFNGYVKDGRDRDFHRGDSLHDHFFAGTKRRGDSGGPNQSLGAVSEPPFYAVAVYPGDLDTKGGLKTDQFGRVRNKQGEVIPGLFATGNCTGSMMGNYYPAGGTTIGPALTFGYIAAKFIAA